MSNLAKKAVFSTLLIGGGLLYYYKKKNGLSEYAKFGLDVVNEFGKSTTDNENTKLMSDVIVDIGKKSIDCLGRNL